MILVWVSGDSLAHPDILADRGDFETHPSEAQCLRCTPNRKCSFYQAQCCVCYGSIHPAAALWNLTPPHSWTPSQYFMDKVHWNWQGWRYLPCALYIIHSPSLVTGFICVDKGQDGGLWFGLFCSDSTIFTPAVDSAVLEWHHSSIFILNHWYSAGLEVDLHLNLYSAHIYYTSIVHADNHLAKYRIRSSVEKNVTFFTETSKCYLPKKSVLQVDHAVRNIFLPPPGELALCCLEKQEQWAACKSKC